MHIACDRGDIEHGTARFRIHPGIHDVSSQKKDRFEEDLHLLVIVLERRRKEGGTSFDAGIVHQNVGESCRAAANRTERPFSFRLRGYIPHPPKGRAAERQNLLSHLSKLLLLEIDQAHRGTLPGQPEGDGSPNPLGGTGHQYGMSGETCFGFRHVDFCQLSKVGQNLALTEGNYS